MYTGHGSVVFGKSGHSMDGRIMNWRVDGYWGNIVNRYIRQ
jgi:hypothetical protein